MKTTAKYLSALVAFAALPAWAAGHEPHAGHTPAPAEASMPAAKPGAMPGMSMMGGGKMHMGDMHGMGLSAERLATLKGELALTPAQLPLWDAFAAAATAMNAGMAMHHGMAMPKGKPMTPGASMSPDMAMPKPGMGMMDRSGPLPERLVHHETMMADGLVALRKLKAALTPLYAALSPAQRAKLDAMPAH